MDAILVIACIFNTLHLLIRPSTKKRFEVIDFTSEERQLIEEYLVSRRTLRLPTGYMFKRPLKHVISE
jgi:hypothetical protein